MKTVWSATGKLCLALWIGALGVAPRGHAQTPATEEKPEEVRTLFLNNVTETRDAEDILTDLRNLLPRAHMYYVQSQGAVSVRGTPDDLAQAEKTLAELDRKRKVYRITYAIAETDAGKPAGTQHVELVIPVGSRTVVKQGNRVPIATGTAGKDNATASTQLQYVDVGLNIDASLEGTGDAVRLRTKVEQSSVGDEKSFAGAQDPVIQQTQMEGWSMLVQGKPTVVGSLDIPGTTRHEEISVVSELVK
jgi:type II secretory pathway component GspD/PulD (secretin)